MPLPSSGSISSSQIKSEFSEKYPNNPVVISNYRGIGYPPPVISASGTIKYSDFYGKSYRQIINITYTGNVNNVNILSAAQPFFTTGTPADIIVTINAGVVIGSNSTGSYALTVPTGSYPSDGAITTRVFIYNYGYIVGRGGDGGAGNCGDGGGTAGGNGGPSLLIQYPTSIYNYGVIAGGGGGGGGGGGDFDSCGKNGCCRTICGGGGGGGAGSIAGNGGFPNGGTASLTSGGGAGGPSRGGDGCGFGGSGGNGGNLGASGNGGRSGGPTPGGGGPGAAGFYVTGNSNVTWVVIGSRLGQVA